MSTNGEPDQPSEPPFPWWKYFQGLLDSRGWTAADFARASGIHASRVVDWRAGRNVSVDSARTVAKVFDVSVVEVLLAAELLSADELATRPAPRLTAADLSDEELLAEVRRRMVTPHIRSAEVADAARYTTTPTRRKSAPASDRA